MKEATRTLGKKCLTHLDHAVSQSQFSCCSRRRSMNVFTENILATLLLPPWSLHCSADCASCCEFCFDSIMSQTNTHTPELQKNRTETKSRKKKESSTTIRSNGKNKRQRRVFVGIARRARDRWTSVSRGDLAVACLPTNTNTKHQPFKMITRYHTTHYTGKPIAPDLTEPLFTLNHLDCLRFASALSA